VEPRWPTADSDYQGGLPGLKAVSLRLCCSRSMPLCTRQAQRVQSLWDPHAARLHFFSLLGACYAAHNDVVAN
jgi:hypothetical protein